MDTNSGEPQKKSTQSDEGIQFTVPEQTASVTVTPSPPSTTHGNHEKEIFDIGRAFSGDSVQKGTIVSDRKRSHTGTTNLLASAWNEWWQKTQHATRGLLANLENNPVFGKSKGVTVAPPETRQNIIQAATSQGAQAPRDDHALVKETIRSMSDAGSAEPVSKFSIKVGVQPSKPQWLSEEKPLPPSPKSVLRKQPLPPPLTVKPEPPSTIPPAPTIPKKTITSREEGTIDLRKTTTPESTPASSPLPTPPASPGWAHFTEVSDTKPALNVPLPTPRAESPHPEVKPLVPKPSPVPPPPVAQAPAPVPKPVPPPLPRAIPQPPPVVVKKVPPSSEEKPKEIVFTIPTAKSREPAHTKSLPTFEQQSTQESFLMRLPRKLLLGIVVVIGITSGVMVALQAYTRDTRPTSNSSITPRTSTSVIRLEKQTPVPFIPGKETLLVTLAESVQGGGGENEVFELIIPGETTRTASVTEFVDNFGENMPSGLKRSLLPSYTVGVLRKGVPAPFIVVSSPEFERAFSGMLVWERTMSEDLSPFFGSPVKSSIPLEAGREPVAPRFVDALDGGIPIRILYDELQNERIVYAIVNKEHILITTTTEALSILVSELK